MALTGPVIGIGVAHALKAPKLVILASGVVGFLGAFGSSLGTNHLIEQGKLIVSGSGDPLGAFIAVVIAAECGRLISGKTKIDIIDGLNRTKKKYRCYKGKKNFFCDL